MLQLQLIQAQEQTTNTLAKPAIIRKDSIKIENVSSDQSKEQEVRKNHKWRQKENHCKNSFTLLVFGFPKTLFRKFYFLVFRVFFFN
ncbi:unnamed protein product [Camellia sinensis]